MRRSVRQRERGKRRAHQAPEQPQDQRHHRQPAVQRQPAERKRQQQEPRIPGDRQAHQGDLHRRRAPRRRPSSTTCTRASSAGPATGWTRTACWPSSPTAASSRAAPSTASARSWRRSSTRSMSWTWAATCAPTRSFPARSTMSSASRPAWRSASWSSGKRQGAGLPDLLCAPSGVGDGGGEAGVPRRSRELRDVEFEEIQPDAKRQLDQPHATTTSMRCLPIARQGNEGGAEACAGAGDLQAVLAGRGHERATNGFMTMTETRLENEGRGI